MAENSLYKFLISELEAVKKTKKSIKIEFLGKLAVKISFQTPFFSVKQYYLSENKKWEYLSFLHHASEFIVTEDIIHAVKMIKKEYSSLPITS